MQMGETPELFNEIASHYDRWSNLLSGEGIRAWHHFAVDQMRLGPGLNILDVGCGTGTATRLMAKAAGPTSRVVGLDPAEAMLGVARKIVPDPESAPVEWVLGAAEHLPFADQTFDRVTAQFSLRNMSDWLEGLKEMVRVLKVGGRLTILEMVQPVTSLGALARRGLDAITANLSNDALVPYQWLGVSLQHAPTADELSWEAAHLGIGTITRHYWLGDLVAVVSGVRASDEVSSHQATQRGPVVWAIDGSVTALKGAAWINRFVASGTGIHLITIIPPKVRAEEVAETDRLFWSRQHRRAQALLDEHRFRCESSVLEGEPGPTMVRFLEDVHASMVVMGKKTRTPSADLWMGSVARYVFMHAPVPTLFVPTAESMD